MSLTRRQFSILTAAVIAGCKRQVEAAAEAVNATTEPTTMPSDSSKIVDAGTLAEFKPDTVSDNFRDQGFFVVHRDRKLFALSSICTHKGCKVRLQPDASFLCKCHGSKFDPDGHVLKGPAKRDLPRLAVEVTHDEHVLVDLSQKIWSSGPSSTTAVTEPSR